MRSALKNLIIAGAVLGLPTVLWAVDAYRNLSGWLWIGSSHTGATNGTLSVGANNIISVVAPTGAGAIGSGLRAYYPNCLVAGQFSGNATPGITPLFILGNGGSDSARRNAMEVWLDGTASMPKVPAKGGISMGIFTAPP